MGGGAAGCPARPSPRVPTSCSSWLCCRSCCRVVRRPSSCSTNGKTWQWKLAGRGRREGAPGGLCWRPGAWAQGWCRVGPPWGSPVSDLVDLLSYPLTPVGDKEGHPGRGLALREWASLPRVPPRPGCPQAGLPSPHRHRVLQLLLRLPEAGDEEAAAGPPEQAFQGSGLGGLHGSCHEAAEGLDWAGVLPPSPSPTLPLARPPQSGRSAWHTGLLPRRRLGPAGRAGKGEGPTSKGNCGPEGGGRR